MTDTPADSGFAELARQIDRCLQRRLVTEARSLVTTLVRHHSGRPDSWLLSARVNQMGGNFPAMLEDTKRALKIAPGHLLARFIFVEALVQCGRIAQALTELQGLEGAAGTNPDIWQRLAETYTQLGRHRRAHRCARRAADLRPDDPDARFGLASAKISLGHLDEAEALLDGVIAQSPGDCDAYYNRATLRRQTARHNHVADLRARLAALGKGHIGEPALAYALGKELEDLGEYEAAFEAFSRGAAARRRRLSYRVDGDLAAIERIIARFDATVIGTPECDTAPGPVFILGLPRSGTTLVDRILSRHADVGSLGEINDLALAIMRLAGPASDKLVLIDRSTQIDFAALGQAYRDAIRGYGLGTPLLIDKTPLNFLYIGLIALALPEARIIHLRRHPMASGYAMFKTLFRMGYPFSYDLQDIGRYYAAYDRLMAHWHRVLPGRILDVQYEELVDDQETVSRRILAHCGLDWDDACLSFHVGDQPTATASAAQVRQPIYRHARDLWRHYEQQLAPLARTLEAAGIDTS